MEHQIVYNKEKSADYCLSLKINRSKKLVLAHGVFDFLHPGHVAHLREASTFGDQLFVSITSDNFVNKGSGRPLFTQSERANMLNALSFVDFVIINSFIHAVNLINFLKPQVYVKGIDYDTCEENFSPNLKLEIRALRLNGGQFRTTKTDKKSTTDYLNRLREIFVIN